MRLYPLSVCSRRNAVDIGGRLGGEFVGTDRRRPRPSPHMSIAAHPGPVVPFDYSPRTRVTFGPGSLAQLGVLAREIAPDARRILLVTDRGLVRSGHATRAQSVLSAAGWDVTVYSDVRENPSTTDVAHCLAAARAARVELFVGLGGGSSMDTAKGTNFLLTNGGEMRDYWGLNKATRPMLPLIAIPTTAGTGSECQSAALIADAVTHQKMACLDPKAAARIALLDPELTLSLPRGITAASGVDALAHALESAVTKKRNPVSDLFSQDAFTRCLPALAAVLSTPADLAARGQMLLGAAHAGVAIENSMLGAAHSAANPLTAHFGTAHGVAVGLMLPHVIRFNAVEPSARARYAVLANAAGLAGPNELESQAVSALIERVNQLLNLAGVPRSLAEAGIAADQLGVLAPEAARQWTASFNPRPAGPDDFRALYTAAFTPR